MVKHMCHQGTGNLQDHKVGKDNNNGEAVEEGVML
jgi:hypothetical protein